MFLKKPFVTILSFVGVALFIFFSAYFTVSYIDNSLIKAIAEASIIILCLMILVFGILYSFINQDREPIDKQFGSITKLPVNKTKPAGRSMPMTG